MAAVADDAAVLSRSAIAVAVHSLSAPAAAVVGSTSTSTTTVPTVQVEEELRAAAAPPVVRAVDASAAWGLIAVVTTVGAVAMRSLPIGPPVEPRRLCFGSHGARLSGSGSLALTRAAEEDSSDLPPPAASCAAEEEATWPMPAAAPTAKVPTPGTVPPTPAMQHPPATAPAPVPAPPTASRILSLRADAEAALSIAGAAAWLAGRLVWEATVVGAAMAAGDDVT